MAVINDVQGLQVQIFTNGTPLKEYTDREAEDLPKAITRYVEVNQEGSFEVLKFIPAFTERKILRKSVDTRCLM